MNYPTLGRGLVRAKVLLAWGAFIVYLLFAQNKHNLVWDGW